MDERVSKRKILYKAFSSKNAIKHLEKKKYIASGAQGNVYKYCLTSKTDRTNKCVVVKKSYIDYQESKFIDDKFNIKALKFNVFIEIAAMTLLNQLVLQNICPNFVLNYAYLTKERIGVCNDDYPYKSLLCNELIEDGYTFNLWVREEHSVEQYYNAYFQIVAAVYSMQKFFNMTHLDLHSKNILVKKVAKGGYWKYTIGDTEYCVPNLGYIFYINDFDQVWVPKTFKSRFIRQRYARKNIHKGFDIMFLFRSTLEFTTSTKAFKADIRKVIKGLRANEKFEEIIKNLWQEKYSIDNLWKFGKNGKLIEAYDLSKSVDKKRVPQKLRFVVV
jgi:hypothetical protein